MRKTFYFLSPVEVVKVTPQNLEEVAEWCGGQVQETDSRRRPGQRDKYVWVPTPKGSTISWAFPGMYITKRLVKTIKGELKATWAVFRRDYFEKNYFSTMTEAVDQTWELENGGSTPDRDGKNGVVVNVTVSEQVTEAINLVKADMEKIAKAAGIDLGAVQEETPTSIPKEAIEEAKSKTTIRPVEDIELPREEKPKLGEHDGRKPMNVIVHSSTPGNVPTAMQEAMARANKKSPKIVQ